MAAPWVSFIFVVPFLAILAFPFRCALHTSPSHAESQVVARSLPATFPLRRQSRFASAGGHSFAVVECQDAEMQAECPCRRPFRLSALLNKGSCQRNGGGSLDPRVFSAVQCRAPGQLAGLQRRFDGGRQCHSDPGAHTRRER